MDEHTLDPKFIAGVKLIERTGSSSFRIGHSDEEEDGSPVIWHATATYKRRRSPVFFTTIHEVDAALDPVQAVLRLCERLVDGGRCVHCDQDTLFYSDLPDEADIIGVAFCVYAWDPELSTFRRSCEGDT